MNIKCIIGFGILIPILTSCVSQKPFSFSETIHPQAIYAPESSSTKPVVYDFGWMVDLYKDSVSNELQRLRNEYGKSHIDSMLQDPFFCREYYPVRFFIPALAKDIENYYESIFAPNWTVVRTNCYALETNESISNSWIRVYAKGDAIIRITIICQSENICLTPVDMDFIGITPGDFLGSNYTLKGKEPYDPFYHVCLPQLEGRPEKK